MEMLRRYPLLAYFVLAFAISWSLILLARSSIYFGLLASSARHSPRSSSPARLKAPPASAPSSPRSPTPA
jgi:hypothetical protein